MQNNPIIITTTAMICITCITLFAAYHGIDGKLITASLVVLGGLGGYHLKDTISKIIHPPPPP
jgi:uncharacterized membrane protein